MLTLIASTVYTLAVATGRNRNDFGNLMTIKTCIFRISVGESYAELQSLSRPIAQYPEDA